MEDSLTFGKSVNGVDHSSILNTKKNMQTKRKIISRKFFFQISIFFSDEKHSAN
jgi:hypothetical protein